MEQLWLIFLIIGYFNASQCRKLNQYSGRFRSIECDANNRSAIVEYCYIKPVSRQHATLNVKIHFTEVIYKPVYVNLILFYRYGNIYREVINTKVIEWCTIMDGIANHLFLMQVIDFVKQYSGNTMRKCPYETDVELTNVTFDETKAYDIFPEGTYKFSWMTMNKKSHEFLWSLNTSLFIKSPYKESWGK
ncbi:hypothetical protein ACKWTF_014783 [Chironomus riparius]